MHQNINWFKQIANQWSVYKSPVTPSPGEILIQKKHIQPNKNILILGATPQLRDLAHDLNAQVTVVDMNMDMIMGMVRLMKNKEKTDKETWVRALWTNLSLKEKYFDYILGDFIIANIPLKLKKEFYSTIKQLLKTSGLFITRHIFLDPSFNIDGVIEYYIKQKKLNTSEWMFAMQSVSYNKKLKQFRLKDINQQIKDYISKLPPQKRNKYSAMHKKMATDFPFEKSWHLDSRMKEESQMKRYFKIKTIEFASDHRLAYLCPIYILSKK